MATTFSTVAAAQTAAASYFTSAPQWVVNTHAVLEVGTTRIPVVIGRDGIVREA